MSQSITSNKTYIDALLQWIRDNQPLLDSSQVTLHLPESASLKSTYVDLRTDLAEATVELWQTGLSDFHVSQVGAEDVVVTHYEFQNKDELYKAMEALVRHLGERSIRSLRMHERVMP